jgi:pimeloyl-ACP methyl ester carboxylesterase
VRNLVVVSDRADDHPLGSFLLPPGFTRPGLSAVLQEASLVPEAGRYARRAWDERRLHRARPYAGRSTSQGGDPVVLVPGFMAGDGTLALMARSLRGRGFRTYRSHIRANVGCTLNAAAQLESRLEAVALRRGSKVQIVGHSLGGMLARGIAVRRPDLVSGIVTLGSPMCAPAAHHVFLSWSVEMLVRLSAAGVPGLMAQDCVSGSCARESWDESREPVPDGVGFTTVFSKRDGIVDWRACIEDSAVQVEVSASHCGMAVDPLVIDEVSAALARHADREAGAGLRIA